MDLKVLKNHTALVTGSSSGIGLEYCKQLAALGVHLVISARRLDRLQKLAQELSSQYGVQVDCIQLDLAEPGAAQALFDKTMALKKEITILINNAGLGKYGHFLDFPLKDHQAVMQVNTVAPTEITYLFAKHMLEHKKPSYITQIASIAAFQPVGNFAVYSGSKGYLRYFSETLAFELRKTNVHVLCVCPGGTYTEFFEHSGQKITSSGHATMMTAEKVVTKSLHAMLRGKTVLVPGIINKIACFMPRLLPRDFALFMAYKTMGRAVEKISQNP